MLTGGLSGPGTKLLLACDPGKRQVTNTPPRVLQSLSWWPTPIVAEDELLAKSSRPVLLASAASSMRLMAASTRSIVALRMCVSCQGLSLREGQHSPPLLRTSYAVGPAVTDCPAVLKGQPFSIAGDLKHTDTSCTSCQRRRPALSGGEGSFNACRSYAPDQVCGSLAASQLCTLQLCFGYLCCSNSGRRESTCLSNVTSRSGRCMLAARRLWYVPQEGCARLSRLHRDAIGKCKAAVTGIRVPRGVCDELSLGPRNPRSQIVPEPESVP